jgi:hypothetical protein
MASTVGTSAVQFHLGSAPASAYLAATPVARTLYYISTQASNDWANLARWFNDPAGTSPAGSLPTASDSVVISRTINSNSGNQPTVLNLTMNDPQGANYSLAVDVTVSGRAVFNGFSQLGATLTGNAVFNDSSSISLSGTVNGNAIFNDSSANDGTVTGTITDNR